MFPIGQVFANQFKVHRLIDKPDTALVTGQYPASGSYIDVSAYERFHVLIHLGSIADALTFKVKQAAAANGALADIDTTDCQHTIAADDDGEYVAFTVETRKLDINNGKFFVTLDVSGVSGNNYAEMVLLGMPNHLPVTQDPTVLPTASQHNFTG
ncbi:MAG: hypothetical protein KJ077_10525 [Anaerolineae bacterium]|nr:hypothetical protein [Anaerolineae bacterium]